MFLLFRKCCKTPHDLQHRLAWLDYFIFERSICAFEEPSTSNWTLVSWASFQFPCCMATRVSLWSLWSDGALYPCEGAQWRRSLRDSWMDGWHLTFHISFICLESSIRSAVHPINIKHWSEEQIGGFYTLFEHFFICYFVLLLHNMSEINNVLFAEEFL